MSTIKDLTVNQSVLKARIEKLIETGKKSNLTKRTQGFYENKIADLKKVWDTYNANDLEIHKLVLADSTLEEQGYVVKDVYGDTESKYSEYMGELMDGLRRCLPASQLSTSSNTTTPINTTIVQRDSQLPKISLPKFNGDYDLWRSFHDLFVSLVHSDSKITPVQKLHYLKGCLVGDAEKLLRHTPITDQDYQPAWEKLEERYNNKRILVNHQLKILVNQQKLNSENSKGIKSLIDTTEECLQQLKSLEVDTSTWGALLTYLLVQKLPFMTLKLWEEEQGATKELPTFTSFKSFLNTRLKILESIADVFIPKAIQHKPLTREVTQSYHTLKRNNCSACSGNHFVQRCPKYHKMDSATRRRLLKSAGHCLNCLSKQHSTNECNSKFRCFRCNEKHHSTIHEDPKK